MKLSAASTALVVIDLQEGIARRDTAPHTAADVVARSRAIATAFRAAGAPVILVTVGWSADMADAPIQGVTMPIAAPDDMAQFVAVVPELEAQASDIRVQKRQWGAFYGTDLDLQLRRRGITTIVLTGIATNMGVESTARSAWEHGYSVVVAEDAVTTFTAEMHAFAVQNIFPRIGRVASSQDILTALG